MQRMWPSPESHRRPPPGMPMPRQGPPPPPPDFHGATPGNPFAPQTLEPKQPPGSARKRMSKQRREKQPPIMLSMKPKERRGPQDIERIADYKPMVSEKSSLGDEAQDDAVPSDESKKEVIRHYLKKWATEGDAAREKEKRGSAESGAAASQEDLHL